MKNIFAALILLSSTGSFCQVQDQYYHLDKVPVYRLSSRQDTSLYSFIRQKIDSSYSINYLQSLSKLIVNKEALLRTNPSNAYFQELGIQLSFIGDYKRAVIEFDSCNYNSEVNEADSITGYLPSLQTITFENARQAILDSARQHNILMINEAHHFSRDRVLTFSLLQDLYKQGYRYFGLEAIGPYRYDMKKPLSVFTGYYTQEPVMADLVRYAIELGFTVFPYEAMGGNPIARDSIQANNIAVVVGNFSGGKLLIHAGYGHIAEHNFGVPALGNILKDLLHTDPFTVNQVDFIQGSRNERTQGLYNWLTAHTAFKSDMPLVMYKNGNAYQVSDDSLYDINIYTPPAKYLNGRPTWLTATGIKTIQSIILPTTNVFLAQAYFEKETVSQALDRCVPSDQTYIFNNGFVDFYLRKGNYLLVFRDNNYKVVGKKQWVVK